MIILHNLVHLRTDFRSWRVRCWWSQFWRRRWRGSISCSGEQWVHLHQLSHGAKLFNQPINATTKQSPYHPQILDEKSVHTNGFSVCLQMESDANPFEIVPIYRDRWEYISDKKSHRVGNIGFLRLLWWNPCRIWSLLTSLSKIWGNIKRSIKTSKQVSQKETAGSCSQWEFFYGDGVWMWTVENNFVTSYKWRHPQSQQGCAGGEISIFSKKILSIFCQYLKKMSIIYNQCRYLILKKTL